MTVASEISLEVTWLSRDNFVHLPMAHNDEENIESRYTLLFDIYFYNIKDLIAFRRIVFRRNHEMFRDKCLIIVERYNTWQ